MKRLWTTFVAVCALCLALVGCGGGGSAKADHKADFIGSWEIVKMVSDGEDTSSEDIDAMKAFGLNVYLDLNEDGSFTLDVFGSPMTGTWEATGANKGSITMQGSTAPMTISDGLLTFEQSGSSMTFKKIDPSEKVANVANTGSDATGTDTVDTTTTVPQYFGGDDLSDLDNASELSVAVVDDETCTIKITAKGVYDGDPGIFFEITNKTDEDILVIGGDDWTIEGATHEAILYELLRGGETLGSIAWFDAEEIGADPAVVHDVTGTIYVATGDGEELINMYEFSF